MIVGTSDIIIRLFHDIYAAGISLTGDVISLASFTIIPWSNSYVKDVSNKRTWHLIIKVLGFPILRFFVSWFM